MTPEEVLKNKNIYYKYSGNDLLVKCFNPDHDDSDPSMRIDKILGIFHCLSCGYKGSLYQLYDIQYDKLSVMRANIDRQIISIKKASTGLSIPTVNHPVTNPFRVSLETLTEFGAFRSIGSDYEGRIIFPIRDLKSKIVCFIGRAEDVFLTPKYKISPSGSKLPLFPLAKIKPIHGRVILVEGLFDMLNLWDNGVTNVLCSFGTNSVKKDKLEILKILGVSGIDLMFDGDDAGQRATEGVKELAESLYFHVRNVKLKEGVDPGDLSSNQIKKLKEKLYGKSTNES